MNEEERQSEHDDPGKQAQGQAEGETPPTASAGDRLSVRCALLSGDGFPLPPRRLLAAAPGRMSVLSRSGIAIIIAAMLAVALLSACDEPAAPAAAIRPVRAVAVEPLDIGQGCPMCRRTPSGLRSGLDQPHHKQLSGERDELDAAGAGGRGRCHLRLEAGGAGRRHRGQVPVGLLGKGRKVGSEYRPAY